MKLENDRASSEFHFLGKVDLCNKFHTKTLYLEPQVSRFRFTKANAKQNLDPDGDLVMHLLGVYYTMGVYTLGV